MGGYSKTNLLQTDDENIFIIATDPDGRKVELSRLSL